jgi:hypothetical protein
MRLPLAASVGPANGRTGPASAAPLEGRVPDSPGAADPEFRRQRERGTDRSAAGRALRRQGPAAQPRGDALGLVPFWAKDIKVGFANINAKAEGIENKPAFREDLNGLIEEALNLAYHGGRAQDHHRLAGVAGARDRRRRHRFRMSRGRSLDRRDAPLHGEGGVPGLTSRHEASGLTRAPRWTNPVNSTAGESS